MVADNAPEKVGPGTHFRRVVHYTHINLTQTETYTPKQNKAYPMIRRLRKRWCKTMSRKNNPGEAMEFWFGLEIRYHYESGLRPYWKYWVQNPDVRTPVFFNRWILTFINGLNIGVIPKSDKIIRSSFYGWGFPIVLVVLYVIGWWPRQEKLYISLQYTTYQK